MSIFRESFPEFIQNELDRRQDGMLARTSQFVHQLNTRSAWVRMTSGVNTYDKQGAISSELAKRYVLQGGVLSKVATVIDPTTQETSDAFTLKKNIGKSFTNNTYSNINASGNPYRLGIRPMPGITGVSINSKGAYGSLQEATVSFVAWDIKQLEELELLYMRPGYTVLLEFGWDYVKPTIPQYDILNKSNITLNDAFAEIYQLIINSEGNYDALLGYVKNYSWVARDDGGYDCTTTIISLGEVLESLKVNWVPVNTYAFSKDSPGLLLNDVSSYSDASLNIKASYEQGIIPGLLHELWTWLNSQPINDKDIGSVFRDSRYNTNYDLYIIRQNNSIGKEDRGGYLKPLGKDINVEAYISLGSFCELLNNYVLLKNENNSPISQVTAYETDVNGNTILTSQVTSKKFQPSSTYPGLSVPIIDKLSRVTVPSSLKCAASTLAISTNLGVCVVRNDNWSRLGSIDRKSAEEKEVEETIAPLTEPVPNDIQIALRAKIFDRDNPNSGAGNRLFRGNIYKRIQDKITRSRDGITYQYGGDLKADIEKIAQDFLNAVTNIDVNITTDSNGVSKQIPSLIFITGDQFTPSNFDVNIQQINLFDYFYSTGRYKNFSFERKVAQAYNDLFIADYDGNREIGAFEDPTEAGNSFTDEKQKWTQGQIINLLKITFGSLKTNEFIQNQIAKELPAVTEAIAEAAASAPGVSADINEFLVPVSSNSLKTLGNIANIYVNINFLYSQAISKNIASNDNQNKNVISIREYLQGILREIQNSLGNINDFDIQVDNRNAIGRIIDINFTGNPSQINNLFELQIHNLNSVVRNYSFQSKIFPEMGAIIAISAQDPEAIGRLGYDNATLVAWNDGVVDRLIPKRNFTSLIQLKDQENPITFIYPFLTQLYNYFQAIKGNLSVSNPNQTKNNPNYAYGGLNFAYRDFLAYLSNVDPRNNFKGIIPTELSVTLDGIGGIVIGNLFKINQDIVPKGYKGVNNRRLAYITTKIGHDIQSNDWTTTLSAYPVIFESEPGVDVSKGWNNQEYPGYDPGSIDITIDGRPIARVSRSSTPIAAKVAAFGTVSKTIPLAVRPLLDTIAYAEGVAGVGQNGYDVLAGFGLIPAWTPDYSSGHPNVKVFIESINDSSTAAGRYQFLYKTWESLGLKEFNKENQDIGGWQLIKNSGFTAQNATQAFLTAQQQITSNNIDVNSNPEFLNFLNRTYNIWASLPNAQGAFKYKNQGGRYTPTSIYQVYIEAVKKYS